MTTKRTNLLIKQVNKVFPFHMVVDKDCSIVSIGKSLSKIGLKLEGDNFFTRFEVKRPRLSKNDFEALSSHLDKMIILKSSEGSGLILKGEFLEYEESFSLIFVGSPMFHTIDQLKENNLSLHDFAHHDPSIDHLHGLKSQEITNNEIDELLVKNNSLLKLVEQTNGQLMLLRKLVDNTQDAIMVAFTNGSLFYMNKEASARLGIPRHQAHQYKVYDFEKTLPNKSAWENHVKELKRLSTMTIEGENINVETKEVVPVEITLNYVEVEGKGYIVANSRDVRFRKHLEKTLKFQEAKFRNIIANMNLGLIEVDNDEVIKFANQSFEHISGYKSDELIGKKASLLFPTDQEEFNSLQKAELRKKAISDSYEMLVKNKQGEHKWWFISGAPNFNDRHEQIGSIGIHLDITEKKELEIDLAKALDRAEEASRAKEAFLANMSHEIRTPLNAIIGMIREMGRDDVTPKQRTFLQHSSTAAKHLLSIVNSILDLSKIEAGEFELEVQNFSLKSMLGNIKSIMYSKALEKGIELHLTQDEELNNYHKGDVGRVRQVLLNLLSNAIKFTEEGIVSLRVEVLSDTENDQKVRFLIKDTGIGMDEAFKDQIFSKFSQEHKSTSRKYGGTGLGMSITYEMIQLMNGEISIDSEKDKGTTVMVDLPLEKGHEDMLKNDTSLKGRLDGVKILLAEDNQMNRFIALQSLKYFGCTVDEALNGVEAVSKVKEVDYDLVLMDIQMPEMDGVQATRIIREEEENEIPIVALTANAFKSEINLYLSIGMNGYVTKPFEEQVLFDAILSALKNVQQSENFDSSDHVSENEDRLYDLSKIIELSHGDEQFVNGMIDIFIQNTPVAIAELRKAIKVKDYHVVAKVAHKIKPSIEGMGISRLHGFAKEIELIAKEPIVNHKNLVTQLDFFCDHLDKVTLEIKEKHT